LRFVVHGPAQWQASPRVHRPPDGDVLGRVHIRVIDMAASATTKDRLALTVLRSAVRACIADSGRVSGIDPFHPILTAISFTGLQPGDCDLDAFAPFGVRLRACKSPLQAKQTLRLAAAKAGYRSQFTCRERSRDDHPPVYADDLARTGTVHHGRDRDERDMPTTRPVFGDTIGLDAVGEVAGPAESQPADLRYPHLSDLARQSAYVPLAAASSDDSEPFVSAGLAPCRSTVRPGEEVTHRLGEISQRLLLYRLRPGRQPREFASRFGQLAGLLPIAGRARPSRAPMRVLLHRKVPDKTGMRAVFQQHLFLSVCRLKPEPHAGTLSTTTDISRRERPEDRVSTPRIR
jgi:hypothetical protein